MKNQPLPSWRTDATVIATRRAIAELEAARPQLVAVAGIARRKFEQVSAVADQVETKALIGKATAKDAAKARADAQALKVALAQADDDLEENDARRAAFERELPTVILDAKTRIGRELLALMFTEAKNVAQAADAFQVAQQALARLGDHIDSDYSGPPTGEGYSALQDFPSPVTSGAPLLAVCSALRNELKANRIKSFRAVCKDNGLDV